MYAARPQLEQLRAVMGRGIAFVLSEGVAAEQGVGFAHPAVPYYLGHVGCGGYGIAKAVAPDYHLERQGTLADGNVVQQQMARLERQVGHGPHHCLNTGLAYADFVDFFMAALANAHG